MMVNLPRNESFENKSDVHLIMQYSQATNKKTTQNFQSDSEDEMCIVRDDNEEMSQVQALSLFLKSPKTRATAKPGSSVIE